MDTGEFQGKVLAELESLGRDMGEVKTEVKENATAITALKVEIAPLLNGTKRKLTIAALLVASAGGVGYFVHSLVS